MLVLSQREVRVGGDPLELSRRRSITLSPRHGARTVLVRREPRTPGKQDESLDREPAIA